MSKISKLKVLNILEEYLNRDKTGVSATFIAKSNGISRSELYFIVSGQRQHDLAMRLRKEVERA